MAVFVLSEARRNRPTPPEEPSTPVEPVEETQLDVSRDHHPTLTKEQQFICAVRAELDEYFCRLKTLNSLPPDAVFATLSMITARLGEIRMALVRTESRRLNALRTREVDPAIDECERQFRIHSRIQACRQFDWEVSGKGQV